MTPLQLNIIKRAAVIRVSAGEPVAEVIASYTALSEKEREEVKAHVSLEVPGNEQLPTV